MSMNSPTRICVSAAAQAARNSLERVRPESGEGEQTARREHAAQLREQRSGSHHGSKRLLKATSTLASANGSRAASARTRAKERRNQRRRRAARRSMRADESTAMTRARG